MAAKMSLDSEKRVRDEGIIANKFAKRDDRRSFRQTRADLRYQDASQVLKRNTARVDKDLKENQIDIRQGAQDRIFSQEERKFERADETLAGSIATEESVQEQRSGIRDQQQGVLDRKLEEITGETQLTADMDEQDAAIYNQELDDIAAQRQQIQDQADFKLGDIDRTYTKAKSENLTDRMEQFAESMRARGSIAAMGRRGQTADAQEQSALASYGRSQAKMVDSMVFASQDKASARAATESQEAFELAKNAGTRVKTVAGRRQQELTRDFKTASLERDAADTRSQKATTDAEFAISSAKSAEKIAGLQTERFNNARNQDINFFNKRQQDLLNDNQKSQLEAALDATEAEVDLARQNISNRMGFNQEEWEVNKKKFKANQTSVRKAYQSSKQKIKLDQYSANLAARANVLPKPIKPPALPVPKQIPYTKFMEPMAPQKPPEPIKGALGKTSVWNDVGDVFNTGLKIASIF